MNCTIENVGNRIRYTVGEFIKCGALSTEPQAVYEEYELLAIQCLDSEHEDWPDGILEQYLQVFLFCIQKELGITDTV